MMYASPKSGLVLTVATIRATRLVTLLNVAKKHRRWAVHITKNNLAVCHDAKAGSHTDGV